MQKLLKRPARSYHRLSQTTVSGSAPSTPFFILLAEALRPPELSAHSPKREYLSASGGRYLYYRIPTQSTLEYVKLADWYGKQMGPIVKSRFDALRKKLRGFSALPEDWDTHGARPISRHAVDGALRLLGLLEKKQIVPNAAIPTSDESILIRYDRGAETFKWEFSGAGEVAFVRTHIDGRREYVDIPPDFQELPA
jgi:hypothetical protein